MPPALAPVGPRVSRPAPTSVPGVAGLRRAGHVPARPVRQFGVVVRRHRGGAGVLRSRRRAGAGRRGRARLSARSARPGARLDPHGRRRARDRARPRRGPALRARRLPVDLRRRGAARDGREPASETALRPRARIGGRGAGWTRGGMAGGQERPCVPPPAHRVVPLRLRLLDPDTRASLAAGRRARRERVAGRRARRRRGNRDARRQRVLGLARRPALEPGGAARDVSDRRRHAADLLRRLEPVGAGGELSYRLAVVSRSRARLDDGDHRRRRTTPDRAVRRDRRDPGRRARDHRPARRRIAHPLLRGARRLSRRVDPDLLRRVDRRPRAARTRSSARPVAQSMMRTPAITALAVVAALSLLAGTPASAGPTEQLREYTDQVIKILDDPALARGDRRAAIRKIAHEAFDVNETARRVLARHWQTRTPAERDEFTQLFADLLERTYIARLDEYGGERIPYVGESIDGELATVRARIVTRAGVEVPVESRMVRRGERWLIYDVLIENVSLVASYRSQFDRIVRSSSYEELVRRLKQKRDEFLNDQARARRSAG